tara:strand:+ start:436 stop:930 length:495 start_codon:yes stop_codon:yes gene_type:complete
MKTKLKLLLVFLLISTVTFAQKSPRKQANGKIGEVTVDVDYGAPSVRDRAIWGELVPYSEVWRAGANENTTISFDKDVKFGDENVPAGKYGFFIIPNNDIDWIVILNKKNDSWGSNDYTEADDILRFAVSPEMVDENQELLQYTIEDDAIIFSWEKVKIVIPVE